MTDLPSKRAQVAEVLSIEHTKILDVAMTEVLSIERTKIHDVAMTEALGI